MRDNRWCGAYVVYSGSVRANREGALYRLLAHRSQQREIKRNRETYLYIYRLWSPDESSMLSCFHPSFHSLPSFSLTWTSESDSYSRMEFHEPFVCTLVGYLDLLLLYLLPHFVAKMRNNQCRLIIDNEKANIFILTGIFLRVLFIMRPTFRWNYWPVHIFPLAQFQIITVFFWKDVMASFEFATIVSGYHFSFFSCFLSGSYLSRHAKRRIDLSKLLLSFTKLVPFSYSLLS